MKATVPRAVPRLAAPCRSRPGNEVAAGAPLRDVAAGSDRVVLPTLCVWLLGAWIGSAAAEGSARPGESTAAAGVEIYVPDGVRDTSQHEPRRQVQRDARAGITAFNEFRFADRQPASGLNFLHRIVDDAGKHYKAVHYDHGNGVAAADVDGDGRIDLFFTSQAGPHGLYLNRGDGRFEDATARAGVGGRRAIAVAASFADIDNDGDADLYVTYVRARNRLYENDGKGVFRDITATSGLGYVEHSSAAVFFDYDRDGRLDLFLCVVGEYTQADVRTEITGTPPDERPDGAPYRYSPGYRDAFGGHLVPSRQRLSRLFRNEGGNRFRDVTVETGLEDVAWTGDATPLDLDGDGWQDLYVLNMQGADQYWRNRQGKRFERDETGAFPKSPWGSMGVKSFDYDNDGSLDLFVTDMHSDMSEIVGFEREKLKADWITANWSPRFLRTGKAAVYGNALFRNAGDGAMEEVSDALGAETFWPWGISIADLNADGWLDAFVTAGMNYPFRYHPNSLLLNDGGRHFADVSYLVGIEPRREGRLTKPWFVLDCGGADGGHDQCRGQHGQVLVNGALGSRSSVIFDVEDDGDLDIVTAEFGDVPQLLLSDLAERRAGALNYLKVKLVGSVSNRDALGARVSVTAGAGRWAQVHDGKSGYLGQSSLPLYFGLGAATRVDAVEVVWPNGRRSRQDQQIPHNGLLEIVEPAP